MSSRLHFQHHLRRDSESATRDVAVLSTEHVDFQHNLEFSFCSCEPHGMYSTCRSSNEFSIQHLLRASGHTNTEVERRVIESYHKQIDTLSRPTTHCQEVAGRLCQNADQLDGLLTRSHTHTVTVESVGDSPLPPASSVRTFRLWGAYV